MNIKRLASIFLIAAVLAVIIRMFVFETILVTTVAMFENQPVGNRLIIEKWSIGARLPLSVGFPFMPDRFLGKKTFFGVGEKTHRIPGINQIARNDVVAFNDPTQNELPLDRHPILLSRCVGLPGEFLHLRGVRLFINDREIKRAPDVSICYRYSLTEQSFIDSQLEAHHINKKTYTENDSGYVYLTRYQYYEINRRQKNTFVGLQPCFSPFDKKETVVPYIGFRIALNDRTFKIWGELINRYEGIKLEKTSDGRFKKDGKITEHYVFKQNYYWMLNDHQGCLNDSRSFGPIPENCIIGKAWMILFSPSSKRFLQII